LHNLPGTPALRKDMIMELDMIVVMALALMFFGGVIYLVIKEHKEPTHRTIGNPASQGRAEAGQSEKKRNDRRR
jgi:hypothetical protein